MSTNNITELNELIYAGAKLVCGKIGIPSKSTKKKVKTRMGNSTGNADKKNLRKQAKMIKQRKETGTCRDKNATQGKITIQLKEINHKVQAKEGRLKRYRQRVKHNRQNRTFQNKERKFYQQLGRDGTKIYQQPDARETQRFQTKIWQPKNITKKPNG